MYAFDADAEHQLASLRRRLLSAERYVPPPVRRVDIPKPDGRAVPLSAVEVRPSRPVGLKGGMLLAVLGSRRPTGDVDLLALAIDNDVAAIADVVRTVLSVTVDNGVTYQVDEMTTQVIRDAALYSGVRLSVPSRIERAKVVLRLDVNVGDPVTPHPVDVEYPALLDRPFHLLGYPLATVLAEKVVTMIERGVATTRERDFADVVVLSRHYQVAASELLAAMSATAEHRQAALRPLAALLDGLGDERQPSSICRATTACFRPRTSSRRDPSGT